MLTRSLPTVDRMAQQLHLRRALLHPHQACVLTTYVVVLFLRSVLMSRPAVYANTFLVA